jgi:hypothetical protein
VGVAVAAARTMHAPALFIAALVLPWDGLVVPSDDAWIAGARVLSEEPLSPELLTPGRSPVPRVGALEQSVHDLGRQAQTTRSADGRAQLYGEIAKTCRCTRPKS